ncbi:unnamed protein product [Nezara viridula]|uniref:Uncharacterized protein n=1 Tax=Nezara viridula TaxID=85310 RepID=A0A9P0MSQ1_NEZVI|nr:unnamed protein product [Nezara viridula]
MDQVNECLKCIELKKSLQVEKKKVSQKNRLITLLRELVRSYEAKDLNLTFTDLSRIYESSSSEVTILKQRLTLYLNENQELLQLKNEISARNDLLDKKYRDVEDEISHLRFVNKQLGDYYREKEADNDQHKDRLKKLARKLLSYEPKNSEVRKILNLQNTPVDLDHKPSKNSNKKKNEENVKDMKKDNIGDDDLITVTSKPSDILNTEELGMSVNAECDNDTECYETNFLCTEEGSNSPSPEPDLVLDANKLNGMSDDFITSQSFDDKSITEKSSEIISNSEDGIITCEESNSSSNCVDSIDHCSFYKSISKDSSSINVEENRSKSPEVLPSLFEEDSCTYEDISEQNEIDANHKNSNDFLEFEGSLPELISPLKSDEQRVLNYPDCNQILQHGSVVQDNSDCDDSNKEITENDVNDKNEKVSTDIKNECSSNSGDQIDKKKKSPHSMFQSKYQALNDGLLFSEKTLNGSHIPLNENYASNYHFQSSHCFGCCNNSFDARPPVTLKLYNCTNVEISIPPAMQKNNQPIITVRDKCDLDKCFVNTSNDVNKPVDPSAIHCSFIPDRRNSQSNADSNNQRIPAVLTWSRPSLNRSNRNSPKNMKETSNPYFQGCRDESEKTDYYFSDYLTKNQVSEKSSSFREPWVDENESESDTIKCSRMFPVKADKQFDLEYFCYAFGSLSLKYVLSKQTSIVNFLEKRNNCTNRYSSLLNISQPPVFHNSLKNSLSSKNKNEWIFGQNFLKGLTKKDIFHKTAVKPTNLLNKNAEENSPKKIKHCNIIQKSVLNLKTNYINKKSINDSIKNMIPVDESVQNPFHKIHHTNDLKGTKGYFKPVCFDINSKKTIFDRKDTIFEKRQVIMPQPCMKPSVENNQTCIEDVNHKPFENNSFKLQSSQRNVYNPNVATETSKSESDLSSHDKGHSQSIFDLDQGKGTSTSNSISHSSICNNKTNYAATSHLLSQKEPILNQIQKPPTSRSSHRSAKEVIAEERSISPRKEHLKENLMREKPVLQKERTPKKIKHYDLPQSKNVSINDEYLFKKPDSVNVKATSDTKITEKNVECKPLINKESKGNLNKKLTFDTPRKIDQSTRVIKQKSSPDVKIQNIKKTLSLQNGLNKESKSLSGTTLKPGNKPMAVVHKKSINISCDLSTDKEEVEKSDNELQEIFKEMKHISIPLLSPLRKTPEISAVETSRLTEIEGSSVENSDLENNYEIIKSKEDIESKDVKDEKINSSLDKPVLNNEILSKCDIIESRLEDNETISESKQSFFSVDESKYKLFSDSDDTESLEEETGMHIEDLVVNDEILEDKEMESCNNNAISPVNDEVLEITEIQSFIKTEEIKIYSRKRKKSTESLEEEYYASLPSSSEYKSKTSEETIPTADYNSPRKDVEPSSAGDNKVELCSSTASDNKPSIALGFYVNRNDEESASSVSVPLLPDIKNPKLECTTVLEDPNPNPFNAAAKDISSTEDCVPENDSVVQREEMQEGGEIPLDKEESPGKKRKLRENNDHVEDTCLQLQ